MAASGERGGAPGSAALGGLRVLVAEDRVLIAAKVVQILRGAGCVVAGPAPTLAAGLELARDEANPLGAAVLDIDLRGEPVYPLAEALRARRVPFLFLTGYGPLAIPGEWRGAPRVEKPFDAPALRGALARLVAGEGPARPCAGAVPAGGEPPESVRRALAAVKRQRDLVMEARIRCAATGLGAGPPEAG